jgi:hypothetical protein
VIERVTKHSNECIHHSSTTINNALHVHLSMERISQSAAHRHGRITSGLEFLSYPHHLLLLQNNANHDFKGISLTRHITPDGTTTAQLEIDGCSLCTLFLACSIIIVLSSSRLHHRPATASALASDDPSRRHDDNTIGDRWFYC